jgi:hypothetical protein
MVEGYKIYEVSKKLELKPIGENLLKELTILNFSMISLPPAWIIGCIKR